MKSISNNRNEEITMHWIKNQPAVLAYILSIVPKRQDAEDILQQVAMITIRKFDDYDQTKSFLNWAIGIARYKILQYKEKNRRKLILSMEAMDQLTELYEEEVSKLNEISTVLEFCLNKLKTKWKHMLEMRYLREYDTGRIARQFNITENAATISLFRIRRALRECINDKLNSMK